MIARYEAENMYLGMEKKMIAIYEASRECLVVLIVSLSD